MRVVENYLTAVGSYLSNKDRQEVLDELRENLLAQVEDKSAELDRELSEHEVASIVGQIGHPAMVAANYSQHQYLIGPSLYPSYRQVVKYAAIALLLIHLLLAIVSRFAFEGSSFSLFGFLYNTFDSILFVVALITISFASMEYYGEKISVFNSWDPKSLITSTRVPASREDAITNMVTDSVVLIWWNNWAGMNSDTLFEANGLIIRASEIYSTLYWPVNVLLIVSVLTYAWLLLVNYWTPFSNLLSLLLDAVTIIIIVMLIQTDTHFTFSATEQTLRIIESVSDFGLSIFFATILIFVLWDTYRHLQIMRKLYRA